MDKQDLTDKQKQELSEITNGCHTVLKNLETVLGKYYEVGSSSQGLRKTWKRLRWEPEDIKELRGRITSNISLLSAFQAQIVR
jgi:hypothetical protein